MKEVVSQHWADQVARELLEVQPRHLLSTGITPSGEYHVGHLRGGTDRGRRALRAAGAGSQMQTELRGRHHGSAAAGVRLSGPGALRAACRQAAMRIFPARATSTPVTPITSCSRFCRRCRRWGSNWKCIMHTNCTVAGILTTRSWRHWNGQRPSRPSCTK